MICYRAAWVVPVSAPPIRDAWVAIDRGRIAGVGRGASTANEGRESDLGGVVVMPGLVNAHTHLELSCLRGRVPRCTSFVGWIRALMTARRELRAAEPTAELQSIEPAIEEAVACGTAVVGDVSNTLASIAPLKESALFAMVFYELIRFNIVDGGDAGDVAGDVDGDDLVDRASAAIDARHPTDRVRATLAAHAPYSVAPPLFRAIRRAIDRNSRAPTSVHLAESVEETEFIRNGTGPWRHVLEELGVWNPAWSAPRVSPVQYLDRMGFLDSRVLAVHGVQMSPPDLATLANRGATLVTCPRSNVATAAGVPPVAEFYKAGLRVAIGTDSLASAPDLNVFGELAALRSLAPDVPASALIDSATRQGARALGFEAACGTIEPGKRARLIAVSVPPGTDDVEEYLVGGIDRDQIRWVPSDAG